MRPRRAPALALVLVLLLSGCGTTDAPTGSAPRVPSSVPTPHERELAPGWDEQPDGEAAVPDGDLSPSELTALLRLPATATSTATACTGDDVRVGLVFQDAAMGHRFGRITVQNASSAPCTVEGYPGIGARGAWGSRFLLVAEQRDPLEPDLLQVEVTLAPGEEAYAQVEWTGELAGAVSEPISLLVVQLADDQDAVGGPVAAAEDGIDIGMLTTVRVGPFQRTSAVRGGS